MSPKKKKKRGIRRRIRKIRRRVTHSNFFIDILAYMAVTGLRLYTKTLKISTSYHPDMLKLNPHRALYGLWHGRQFLIAPALGPWHLSVMTDLSWAGELQTRILQHLGYIAVRGSSKRKGADALIKTRRSLQEGHGAIFALDGPRGPIYRSKPGIVFLAGKTGFPIIPVCASARKAWIIKKTWCKYVIPKPFSRCLIAMGAPVYADGDTPLAPETLDAVMINFMEWADGEVKRGSREEGRQ